MANATIVRQRNPIEIMEKRLEEMKDMIIQYVSDNGFISRRETESLINAGSSKSAQILSELLSEGRLTVSVSGNKVRYIKE